MSEDNTIHTILNAELPASVDKAFQNLTDNLTQNIGTTLSDIWYLVFGGFSHLAEKRKIKYAQALEQFREELNSSIADIPPEKQIEPSFQVTVQALENAKYCITESELREMFTLLISNSMNSDFSKDLHPSFAEIIKQMSILDAKIMKKFKSAPPSGIPICDYHAITPGEKGFTTALENVFLELPEIGPEICSASISSLERLGLIKIPLGQELLPPERYDIFKQHPLFLVLQEKFPNKEFSVERHLAKLTPLGQSFVKVCIPD